MKQKQTYTVAEYNKMKKGSRSGGRKGTEEQDLQMNCVKWFELSYPKELILHYPAGGYRTKAEAGIIKAMGVKKDIPDLFIPAMRGGYGGLWVELKKPGESPSPEQVEMIMELNNKGYKAVWSDNLDHFMGLVRHYMEL